ncbi:MAG TPA: hypothetical protein VGJ93_11830 [Desulfuromonadaceae bacterium]
MIRRRRWYFWLIIMVYLPATWSTLAYSHSYRITGIVFAIWFVLLCVIIVLLATAKCPSCGKYFHMRNASLSIYRSCRHCGLNLGTGKVG